MQFMNALLFAAATSDVWRYVYIAAFLVGAFVVPFVVGALIARAIRMKEYGWKIGLIFCTMIVAAAVIGRTWNPETKRFDIPLGVDLQGGVILIYEVDQSVKSIQIVDETKGPDQGAEAPRGQGQYSMSALIEALSRRINPSGTKEIVLRPYGMNQVEIIIPEVDQRAVEQIKKVISTSGNLEFRIIANTRAHQDVIDLARAQADDPIQKRSRAVRDDSGEQVGLWARVAREQIPKNGIRPFKVDVSDFTIRDASSGELLQVPAQVFQAGERGDDTRRMRLAQWVQEQGIQEIDVLMATNDGLNVTGAHLASVMKSKDEFMNPDIMFTLTTEGTPIFAELTDRFKPDGQFHHQLGIVLDNELLSAPNIQEKIIQHGRITGRFTEEEVQFLVNILEAGSLPVVLNKVPISQSLISPLLGRETIEQGRWALVVATIAIFVFMLVYYRFSGFLACLALVLNILFTLAIMVLIQAPLTMPGLAGLVLTIGMSVDANVLIFERMREELARGSALRMTIRNGFARATATIIDANVTTILTAVILYAIGTDQLRGFAVTLILGILTSMFTAIFCARVAFDIVERKRLMTSLKMFQFLGTTNLDFVGKRNLALGVSAVLLLIGMAAAVVRGEDLFDIDFTGGTSVHVNLEEPADAEEVRAIVDPKFKSQNITYTLTGMSVAPGQTESDTFKVDARIEQVEDLEKLIQEAFKESNSNIKLATYSLTFGSIKPSASRAPAKPEGQESPPGQPVVTSADKDAATEQPSEKPAETPAEKTEPMPDKPAEKPAEKPEPAVPPSKPVEVPSKSESNPAGKDAPTTPVPEKEAAAKEEPAPAAAEKPAAEKPAEKETPKEDAPAEKPAENEAAEKPEADKAESKEGSEAEKKDESARLDLPSDEVFALAFQPPAETKSETKPEEKEAPAAEPTAESQKAEAEAKPETEAKPAAEEKPVAEAAAPEAAKPAAETSAKAAQPDEETSEAATAPAPTTQMLEVELKFGHPINEPTLRGEIEQTARELNIPLSTFDLSNPAWQGGSNAYDSWTLKIPATVEETQRILETLQNRFVDTPVWSSSEKIGPQVAGKMRRTAVAALVASWIGIIIYVWIRFQNIVFGIAAVAALVHDVLITVAALALSSWLAKGLGFLLVEDFKISLTIVAALLTIIGYSINDTIVIFDRLREIKGKSPTITPDMVNLSLNQTLSRTLLTAFTVFIVVFILYGFGGQGIHGFAFAMLIGVISGTYSTVYIATPMVLWMTGKPTNNSRTKSAAA